MKALTRIKTHLRENKKLYVGLGLGIVAGAAAGVLLTRTNADTVVNSKIYQVLAWKPQATLEVYIEALGDPGNIVQDTTTGTIYASQNQAANALGLHKSQVSQYLNGKNVDLNGHDLIKLGKAQVSQ